MALSCSKKRKSGLLHAKHKVDFYCLNCHSFRTENKLKSHEKVYIIVFMEL